MNPRWFYPLLFSKQSRSTSLSSHHPLSFSLCSLFSVLSLPHIPLFSLPSFSLCLPFLFPPAFSPGVPLLGGSPAWGSPCFPYVIIGTVTSIRICGYIIIVNIIYVVIPNTIAAPCPTFPVFTVISALSLKYIYLIILI